MLKQCPFGVSFYLWVVFYILYLWKYMYLVCWTFFFKFYYWNYRVPSMSDSSFVVKDYANIFQVNDLFSKGNKFSSSHLFYLIKIICNGQGQPNKGNDLWHHKNCTLTEDMHIWLSNYFYRPLLYLSWWSIWQEKPWDLGLNPRTILWEREMEIKTELIQVL